MPPSETTVPSVATEPSLTAGRELDRMGETGRRERASSSARAGWFRPWIIALFAILLLARSGFAQTLQWDGATGRGPGGSGSSGVQADPGPSAHLVNQGGANPAGARPESVELFAGLANLDRDAAPDGWRAEIIVRDRHDQITTPRGHARFELRDRWADPSVPSPIRWSIPLRYDPDGIARMRLPMRGDDARHLSAVSHGTQGIGTGRFRQRSVVPVAIRGDFFDSRWVAAPSVGRLLVTVSVPGQGTFKASADVIARPATPVDWNDRSRQLSGR